LFFYPAVFQDLDHPIVAGAHCEGRPARMLRAGGSGVAGDGANSGFHLAGVAFATFIGASFREPGGPGRGRGGLRGPRREGPRKGQVVGGLQRPTGFLEGPAGRMATTRAQGRPRAQGPIRLRRGGDSVVGPTPEADRGTPWFHLRFLCWGGRPGPRGGHLGAGGRGGRDQRHGRAFLGPRSRRGRGGSPGRREGTCTSRRSQGAQGAKTTPRAVVAGVAAEDNRGPGRVCNGPPPQGTSPGPGGCRFGAEMRIFPWRIKARKGDHFPRVRTPIPAAEARVEARRGRGFRPGKCPRRPRPRGTARGGPDRPHFGGRFVFCRPEVFATDRGGGSRPPGRRGGGGGGDSSPVRARGVDLRATRHVSIPAPLEQAVAEVPLLRREPRWGRSSAGSVGPVWVRFGCARCG